jgi:hypothetical protein
MFSLQQLRDLFYFHLHRSSLKNKVEGSTDDKLAELKQMIKDLEAAEDQTRAQIQTEKASILHMVELNKHEVVKANHLT